MKTTIEVIRSSPPEIARCRAPECQRLVEWVLTRKNNRRMPIDHPLVVDYVSETLDGQCITGVSSDRSHFATCVAASRFSRKGRR